MSNDRRKYSPAEELALTTQARGVCPLCGRDLFYVKNARSYRNYELAHIYPLNPSKSELYELRNEERLHTDKNHPDNIIPLCRLCHGMFDKPRVALEYRSLIQTKRVLIRREEQQKLQSSYKIEEDIRTVIEGLYTPDAYPNAPDLEYDARSLVEKFDASMPILTQKKIRYNVADYYQYIRHKFLEMERASPTISELIATQVRAYYLEQKRLGLAQHEVFANIVDWLHIKTTPDTVEAAEIVTSFFIQNCEVFE